MMSYHFFPAQWRFLVRKSEGDSSSMRGSVLRKTLPNAPLFRRQEVNLYRGLLSIVNEMEQPVQQRESWTRSTITISNTGRSRSSFIQGETTQISSPQQCQVENTATVVIFFFGPRLFLGNGAVQIIEETGAKKKI